MKVENLSSELKVLFNLLVGESDMKVEVLPPETRSWFSFMVSLSATTVDDLGS